MRIRLLTGRGGGIEAQRQWKEKSDCTSFVYEEMINDAHKSLG
jgi:hypothetical protein